MDALEYNSFKEVSHDPADYIDVIDSVQRAKDLIDATPGDKSMFNTPGALLSISTAGILHARGAVPTSFKMVKAQKREFTADDAKELVNAMYGGCNKIKRGTILRTASGLKNVCNKYVGRQSKDIYRWVNKNVKQGAKGDKPTDTPTVPNAPVPEIQSEATTKQGLGAGAWIGIAAGTLLVGFLAYKLLKPKK